MKKYGIILSIVVVVLAIAAYYHAVATPEVANDDVSDSATTAPPQAAPQNQLNAGYPFQDTSMLKPPAGAKVAIFEFEDMECPACGRAFPIVHAAADHYKIPLLRRDYPWTFHVWSFDAAVTARYIQDKLSPQLADDFRRDIFSNQRLIESKDDLTHFTAKWFQSHGQHMPFIMDASGTCRNEVEADRALGNRLGVKSTPCIIVVTQTQWVPVEDLNQLNQVVEAALAQTSAQTSRESGLPAATLRTLPARS
jgi:hypothetical protein